MNTKRQTIWLVSMLGLMVVLSAYYLFTDTTGQGQLASLEGGQDGTNTIDATEVGQDGLNLQGDMGVGHEVTMDSTDAATQHGDLSDNEASADQQVLDQVEQQSEAVSGSNYFIVRQMERNDDYTRESERLMKIITDSKVNTDALSKAYEDERNLEEIHVKLTNLEDLLMKDYQDAVVLEENGKFKVVVQSDQLEKSEAVSIADMVLKELEVTPDRLEIQYIQ